MTRIIGVAAIAAALLAATATTPEPAEAHPVGWSIHRALCRVGIGCRDVPPKPGPRHPCTPANSGEIAIVYDPTLKADVKWRCVCVETGCRWVRVEIVIGTMPWQVAHCYRYVIDFHRACRSVVCNMRAVEHRYRTRGSFFNPGCTT